MNEKIKQLVDKTAEMIPGVYTLKYEDGGEGTEFNEASLEKFAELIVKECAEQIIAKGTDCVDFAPSQTGVRSEYWAMAQQIKQHFGVEE